MGGAFVYMFASESLREKIIEFENSLPIDAMSGALYNFADKYNIGFLKDGFFSDPIMLLLILSLICYIAWGCRKSVKRRATALSLSKISKKRKTAVKN